MLLPVVPLALSAITSNLPQVLVEQGISSTVKQGKSLVKRMVNKVSSRVLGKELFKQRVSDLTIEDFQALIKEEFDVFQTTFRTVLQEEISAHDPAKTLVILEQELLSIKQELNKALTSQEDTSSIIEQFFTENQEWLTSELLSVKQDVLATIKNASEEQVLFLQTIQSSVRESLEFTNALLEEIKQGQRYTHQTLNELFLEVQRIKKLLEEGKRSEEEKEKEEKPLEKAYKLVWTSAECPLCGGILPDLQGKTTITCHYCDNTFHIQDLKKTPKPPQEQLTANKLLNISALQLGSTIMSSRNDIEYDPEKYVHRTDVEQAFQQYLKQKTTDNLFLLLGEAGFGKTWLSAHLAHHALTVHRIPTFYLPLRFNFRDYLHQSFYFQNDIYKILEELKTFASNTQTTVLLILDGYDEILDTNERKAIIGYFIQALRKNPHVKIMLSSRTYDWQECYLVKENKPQWRPIVWKPHSHSQANSHSQKRVMTSGVSRKGDWSYLLQEFTEPEIQQALEKYELPPLKHWAEELKSLAKYPLWLRFLYEYQQEQGTFPQAMTLKLIEAYLERMSITENDKLEIYKLTNALIQRKNITRYP